MANYFGEIDNRVPVQTVGESTNTNNNPNSLPTSSMRSRTTSKGNVNTVDELGELLRKLTNAAWGSKWGELSPDLSRGIDSNEIISPQINYSTNLREVSKGTSTKPTLTDTIDEVVNGRKTGDSFRVYRQSFDCIVEFNFWGDNSHECSKLMSDFEDLLITQAGYIKNAGVSEIFLLKEVPANYSLKFSEEKPMRCLYYYVRLERIKSVRVSLIREIETKVSTK